MGQTFRTALMDDLADVRVDEFVRSLIQRDGTAIGAAWESEIAQEDRSGVTALVTGSHAIGLKTVDRWKRRFPRLSMLSLAFTGTDRVKMGEIWNKYPDLSMYNVPGYATNEVAEHAIGLTLAVLRRVVMGCLSARAGDWDDGGVVPGRTLAGSSVGIVGTGPIGINAAEKFAALGCSILAYSPKNPDKPRIRELRGQYVSVDELFSRSDIVTLHVRSTPETARIANRERIESMKHDAVLINTGRGSLVDNHALADALRSKRIFGAGIDVFETDPIRGKDAVREDPLLSLDLRKCNLVATPHVAFKASAALVKLAFECLENVKRWEFNPGDDTHNLKSIEP